MISMWYQLSQAEVVRMNAQVPAGTNQEQASRPMAETDLLVVLCSEQATRQVVNTGSLPTG